MSQEIRKIEQSFGTNKHLMKRLTLLDYDADLASPQQSFRVPSYVKINDRKQHNSFKQDANLTDEEDENEMADTVDFDGGSKTDFKSKLSVLDGPGLGPEPARLPSTSNLASTLFRLKSF